MLEQITAILGAITGVIAILSLLYNRIYHDATQDKDLAQIKEALKTYKLPEMSLMVTTMWQAYTTDLPHRRPDLAENHSPCSLRPAGLAMIPPDMQAELDKIEITPEDKENVVTGYLVTKIIGLKRINELAQKKGVLVQEMIGILSTYLDCKLSQKK